MNEEGKRKEEEGRRKKRVMKPQLKALIENIIKNNTWRNKEKSKIKIDLCG